MTRTPQYVAVYTYVAGPGTVRLCAPHAEPTYRREAGLPALGPVQVSRRWAHCDRCWALLDAFQRADTKLYREDKGDART
jgi:hypothetical protein